MADFAHTMRNWRRMCETLIREHDGVGYKACEDCPLNSNPICTTETKDLNAFDIMNAEKGIMKWAAEHPEPVYPTWLEYLCEIGVIPKVIHCNELYLVAYNGIHDNRIPADIAEKLEIQPKEE